MKYQITNYNVVLAQLHYGFAVGHWSYSIDYESEFFTEVPNGVHLNVQTS